MQSHEVLREVLKKTSAKQIAAEMGLSLSLIYKWAEPPSDATGSGAHNPLDRVDQLLQITKDARIAQWVCERAGWFLHYESADADAAHVLTHPDHQRDCAGIRRYAGGDRHGGRGQFGDQGRGAADPPAVGGSEERDRGIPPGGGRDGNFTAVRDALPVKPKT
jgi:hypothetical protein